MPSSPKEEQVVMIDIRDPESMMYFPMLLGGDPDEGSSEDSREPQTKKLPQASPPSTKGLSYPGPQPILSNVPEPTNLIQTVLQPELENPRILIPPLLLPNIIQLADRFPVPQEPPDQHEDIPDTAEPVAQEPAEPPVVEVEVRPAEPLVPPDEPAAQLPIDAPELALPTVASVLPEFTLPELAPLAKPPEPEPKPIQEPPRKPEPESLTKPIETAKEHIPEKVSPPQKAVEKPQKRPAAKPFKLPEADTNPPKLPSRKLSPLTSREVDILALTPIPALPTLPAAIPSGEARGRFAISPESNLATSETEPGSKTGIPSSEAGVISLAKAPETNEAAMETDSVFTVSIAKSANVSRPTGSGVEGEGAAAGSASGTKTASSTGSGSGPGSTSGAGTKAFSGITIAGSAPEPNSKAFSGITIVGGAVETKDGAESILHAPAPKPLQTSYGLSIISTEDSGGGLPVFGVFDNNEQVYTVYLDMRQKEADQNPAWTLEFAVLQDPTERSNAAGNPGRSKQGLILPFPISKEHPILPLQVVRKNLGKMIIVYAIINAQGKMEKISIKDSPDGRLLQPLLEALAKWVFRPARLDGAPVAVKVLMGIPLWLPG
jgi:hypothetical protein